MREEKYPITTPTLEETVLNAFGKIEDYRFLTPAEQLRLTSNLYWNLLASLASSGRTELAHSSTDALLNFEDSENIRDVSILFGHSHLDALNRHLPLAGYPEEDYIRRAIDSYRPELDLPEEQQQEVALLSFTAIESKGFRVGEISCFQIVTTAIAKEALVTPAIAIYHVATAASMISDVLSISTAVLQKSVMISNLSLMMNHVLLRSKAMGRAAVGVYQQERGSHFRRSEVPLKIRAQLEGIPDISVLSSIDSFYEY